MSDNFEDLNLKDIEKRIRTIAQACTDTEDLQHQLADFLVNTEKGYTSFEVAVALLVTVNLLANSQKEQKITSDNTAALAKVIGVLVEKKIEFGEVNGYYARGEGKVEFNVYSTDRSVN